MPLVSIIANFYNSEKFIPLLMDSIINQTFKKWELICVNDCSPMNDLQLLNAYALKDPRIKVVDNKTNMGISKAKFEGIKHATGKYLMFIDGDDWLEKEAIERCLIPAEHYDCDMVIMSSQKVIKSLGFNYRKEAINQDVNRLITQPELFDRYYINFFGINLFPVTYWGKLIRREAFDRANLSPSPSDYSEDVIFNMYLFPHLRSMYLLDYVGYNWRWGGITSGRLKVTEKRVFKLLSFVMDFYEQRLDLLKQYDYQKGFKYLTIEYVNYLFANFQSIAFEESPTKAQLDFISRYLTHLNPRLKYILDCKAEKYDVITSNDPKIIYTFCHNIYIKNRFRTITKSIIHSIVFS